VRTAAARDHLLDVCADMEVLDMKSVWAGGPHRSDPICHLSLRQPHDTELMKKIGCCYHATKRGKLIDLDLRGFVTMSFERPRVVCICSLMTTNHEPQGKTTPRCPLPRFHKSVVFLHACSCCTWAVDLSPLRVDLTEEEQAHEPAL
jgi:hypothetical protein